MSLAAKGTQNKILLQVPAGASPGHPDDAPHPSHVSRIQTSDLVTPLAGSTQSSSKKSPDGLGKVFALKVSVRSKLQFSPYPRIKADQEKFKIAARQDTAALATQTVDNPLPTQTAPPIVPSATYDISQLSIGENRGASVKPEEMGIVMDMNEHSTPHPLVEHLTCPPKALVECMFPDAYVFPASLLMEAPMPSGSLSSRTSKPTVEALFNTLSNEGLYSKKVWTCKAMAPDFKKRWHTTTESNFAAFLNTIVNRTAELIGAKSEEVRTWSASYNATAMQGCFENRRPDIFVKRKEAPSDWRTVDCVVELKNGAQVKDSESLGQIAERARTLFNVQDTHRFALLIRIKQDEFSYTAYDRGGSITSPFVNINTHALLFYRLILGKINGRGTTVRLLKVNSEMLANFYGDDKQSQYKSLPGVKPGQKNFEIISKDSWEEVHDDSGELSEGILLQLLHAKGVLGVSWCLDEKPVLAPNAPAPPIPIENHPLFIDNTLYIRSRWGIRTLRTAEYAINTLFRQEVNANKVKIQDEAMTQIRSTHSFASLFRTKMSRIIPTVKSIFPKVKQSEIAGSSSLPSSAMSSSHVGKKADKGKKKMDGEKMDGEKKMDGETKKKTDKGKKKTETPSSPSSPSSPPATSPTALGQTAAQPSHTPQVFIDDDREKNRQFTVRCHVRLSPPCHNTQDTFLCIITY